MPQFLFGTSPSRPLWFVGDSPKRTLDDYDPERDKEVAEMVGDGLPLDQRAYPALGYAQRIYTPFRDKLTGSTHLGSATIDIDIDVPLFTPVYDYDGQQDDISWIVGQSALGLANKNVFDEFVSTALEDLTESSGLEHTPYIALKKAYRFFSEIDGVVPVVEVDPVSLKAHFTLYTGYIHRDSHIKIVRMIAETFFAGMYDKALVEDNKRLSLTRAGSRSKHDGENNKQVSRRFLWSPNADDLSVLVTLIKIGAHCPVIPEQHFSKIRARALRAGIDASQAYYDPIDPDEVEWPDDDFYGSITGRVACALCSTYCADDMSDVMKRALLRVISYLTVHHRDDWILGEYTPFPSVKDLYQSKKERWFPDHQDSANIHAEPTEPTPQPTPADEPKQSEDETGSENWGEVNPETRNESRYNQPKEGDDQAAEPVIDPDGDTPASAPNKKAWNRTLREKSRTGENGHRVGFEAIYLMLALGEDARFAALYGDPARVIGLRALASVASGKSVRFDDSLHVLRSELSYPQWNRARRSIAKTIGNMSPGIHQGFVSRLADIILDTALYGMGQEVGSLALDITRDDKLSAEWMSYFNKVLHDIGHYLTTPVACNPYAVRNRQRKIHLYKKAPFDPIGNAMVDGRRGSMSMEHYISLVGATLNFETEPLFLLPTTTALQVVQKALVEHPERHAHKRDLRQNSAYVQRIIENIENGVQRSFTPGGHMKNAAARREMRLDLIQRAIMDGPATPENSREIVAEVKGDAYDPAVESFTAILSLTRDILGKGGKYQALWDIRQEIISSDSTTINGEIAVLKALLAQHVESLSRSAPKRQYGSSRNVLDLASIYRRDWGAKDAKTKPWSGELLAKQFDRVTRDLSTKTHEAVIAEDEQDAKDAFKKKEKVVAPRKFSATGTPDRLLPKDIDNTPLSSLRARDLSEREKQKRTEQWFYEQKRVVRNDRSEDYALASQIFSPKFTFVINGKEVVLTAQEFAKHNSYHDVLSGNIYMKPTFSRSFGGNSATGKIDQYPCPTSTFLKTEVDSDGEYTVTSIANEHYFDKDTFTASVLLLSVLSNKSRLSFDRAIKTMHSLDKIMVSLDADESRSIPISSRYLAMKSGLNHNEANSILQDLSAIGLIDRTGGRLRGTLLGPSTTKEEQKAEDVCDQIAPGIIGQEKMTGQDFVESGQFLSTYTIVNRDRFTAEVNGEFRAFTPKEIIDGFKDIERPGPNTVQSNPFLLTLRSALLRLDAAVDKSIVYESEDSRRKSNLFEVRAGITFGKLDLLGNDQYQANAGTMRSTIVNLIGYAAPENLDGMTDISAAFCNTSNLYKGEDSEIIRTYGYWVSSLLNASEFIGVAPSQVQTEFNRMIRFISGRSQMFVEIVKRVRDFTLNVRSMEIAYRAWLSSVADLARQAREFRRSYRALVKSSPRSSEALIRGYAAGPLFNSRGEPQERVANAVAQVS